MYWLLSKGQQNEQSSSKIRAHPGTQPQGGRGVSAAGQGRAGAAAGAVEGCCCGECRGAGQIANATRGPRDELERVHDRCRSALGAVLGDAVQAWQPVSCPSACRAASGAAFRVRNGARCPQLRAAGELCPAAHYSAQGREGRPRGRYRRRRMGRPGHADRRRQRLRRLPLRPPRRSSRPRPRRPWPTRSTACCRPSAA